MSSILTHAISASLIGSGVFAWAFAGPALIADAKLKVPLNPFGINGSPYGEVFAMAMQGPIDTYFNGAMGYRPSLETEALRAKSAEAIAVKPPVTLKGRFKNLLASLDTISEVRTNPAPASSAHKFYLRRQAEDKLRFAYQLDPSHYANYNSLHFFLTQPQLGTRPELTPSAIQLAAETIEYCLKQNQDPRPALTAAAAVTNVLELMFSEHKAGSTKFTALQMHQQLDLLNLCLTRYVEISKKWDQTKSWDLLSPMRILECEDRFSFIGKIREAAIKTIARIDGNSDLSNASN